MTNASTREERDTDMITRLFRRLFRKQINAFAKWIILKAKERMIIDSDQMHEMAGIVDRALWPERYR